ncbi:hypothetical protein Jab_1c01930 [Janthinobacterium sp. HH01]|uniref:hypothetical protein n=1 Tax=Janthinobacterium sp. HH01 TaxID=1198452 RepID=UPI0002AEACE3|nr:hypothetical protein [Janthinobacterium sp. HH01]ELX11609.1 hypothetical protein Jab_1c01930 [Janthinobacterium sp. HH01]
MKSFYSALLLSLCLALGSNAYADARTSSHSGTSSSYKSGFSSQKNNARSKPTAPPAGRQSGPGAFGKAPGSPASATPRNTSAASRDLDQSAAQANAMRTLDARRNAAAVPPPPPLNDAPARQQSAPAYQAPGYQAPPVYRQAPVIVQQPSNGLMHGVLGFMLGRAMSQSHQPVSYPTTTAPAAGTVATGGSPAGSGDAQAGMINGMPGLGAPVPAAPPAPSFLASVARWMVWLGVLGAMAWGVVYTVRKLRRLRAGGGTNYSFERN